MDRLKPLLMTVGAIVTACFVLTGCETVKGAGKDIESAGEAMQDAAHDAEH